MESELSGSLHLLMRSIDFENLSEVLRPTLKLLYLSSPDASLVTLENQKPEWMDVNNEYQDNQPQPW